MNLPSIKTLEQITDSRDEAKQLRQLLEARTHSQALVDLVIEHYPHTLQWLNSCYNRPRNVDIIMNAANELLGTSGVEIVAGEYDHPSGDVALIYCNTGDTYAATLCYSPGRFFVSSWGDWVEKHMPETRD